MRFFDFFEEWEHELDTANQIQGLSPVAEPEVGDEGYGVC